MEISDSSGHGERDRASMEAVRRGDSAAVGELYDRYASLLLALALRILRDRGEAEELIGDVFWELWKRPERYDPARGSLSTFLITVTRSRAIDRLRARTRKESVVVTDEARVADAAAADEASTPFDSALLNERRRRVSQAIGKLTAEQRTAIELAFYAGLSHSEIATSLEEPLGTVKSRIRLGLIHLRDSLRTMYGGTG